MSPTATAPVTGSTALWFADLDQVDGGEPGAILGAQSTVSFAAAGGRATVVRPATRDDLEDRTQIIGLFCELTEAALERPGLTVPALLASVSSARTVSVAEALRLVAATRGTTTVDGVVIPAEVWRFEEVSVLIARGLGAWLGALYPSGDQVPALRTWQPDPARHRSGQQDRSD